MAEATKKVSVSTATAKKTATTTATAAKATTATATKAPAKATTTKKATTAKKATTTKKATTAKKTTAKKSTAKKSTAKKTDVVVKTFVQWMSKDYSLADVTEMCKKDFKENFKRKTIEEIRVYVNVDDNAAYYVVKSADNEISGKVAL